MRIGKSITKAIDEMENGDTESAMLHACNAIDGVAAKMFPTIAGNNARFTKLLRDHYPILGPMGLPGINLVETRFPVAVKNPKAAGGRPDLADIIYGIHRCSHGHGDELPNGFQLISDSAGPSGLTRVSIHNGCVALSDRIVFGLISVAVLAKIQENRETPEGCFLTFGSSATLMINDWWGRANDFPAIAALEPIPLVTLDFGDWHT